MMSKDNKKKHIERDQENIKFVDQLIDVKFIKKAKKCRKYEYEINIMLSRMISSGKYTELLSKIEEKTSFLPSSFTIKDRIVCIFHNLKQMPTCRFCGKQLTEFLSLSVGYKNTCGDITCSFKLREETYGGPVATGKHNFSEKGMKAIKDGAKNRESRKGKSYKEILKNPEDYESFLEKLSLNANREKTGWFSKYRCEFVNPNTNKIITLMSSYEITFVNFCIKNNIWFDSCHARLKYWNEVKQGFRYYNPDFTVLHNDTYYMIEIKPSQFLLNNKNDYNLISRNKVKRLYEHCVNYNRICLLITEVELKDEKKLKKLLTNAKSNYMEYINEN